MLDALGRIFHRDIVSLRRELELYPDDTSVWKPVPGMPNCGGTLVLHLLGNRAERLRRRGLNPRPRHDRLSPIAAGNERACSRIGGAGRHPAAGTAGLTAPPSTA